MKPTTFRSRYILRIAVREIKRHALGEISPPGCSPGVGVPHWHTRAAPALGDGQARKLPDAPSDETLKGVRDRAILATLLYHGIRREELCGLRSATCKAGKLAAF